MAYFPKDLQSLTFRQFSGSAQSADPYDIDIAHGLYTQNVDFVVSPDGTAIQARSRLGVQQLNQTPNDNYITSMANWHYTNAGIQVANVIYYSNVNGVKSYGQLTGYTATRVNITSAAYVVFAFNGIFAYMAFTGNLGRIPTAPGYVLNDQTNNADQILTAPIAKSNISVFSVTATGSGVVTAGPHNFAFLVITRSGQPVLCPASASSNGINTLAPIVNAAVSTGAQSITMTITFTGGIPASMQGQTVQAVMTTASNNARYFLVPGATSTMPNATSGTVTIPININDGDLAATATDITFYQNLLTQNLSGTAPFQPFSVFTYSSRMGYCTYDLSGFPVVYFSDQNSFQSLTAAFHGIYLESRQIPVQGVSLGAVCYIATLSGLYSTQDNGGYPATWTPPMRVDGSVGILAPSNMTVSGGRINVASEKGLFFYRGGAFPQVPVSYWQTNDWNRINWLSPTQVMVVDDELHRVLRVIAPLTSIVTNASNTNPIVITTAVVVNGSPIAYPHLFQTGLTVTVSGVQGNTAANTTQMVTVTGPNTFTIPVAGNGTYTGGGVAIPLSPNAELTWNYSKGESPGELMYSLNAFSAYLQGAAAIIRNVINNLDEVWYMPASTSPGGLLRKVIETDPSPNQDVDQAGTAVGINSQYETGLCPQVGGEEPEATLHDFHGMHMRVTGNGNLNVTAYTLDHASSLVPARSPFALSPTSGQEELFKWFARNEQQSVAWGTNAVGAWWLVAMVKQYYKPSVPFR